MATLTPEKKARIEKQWQVLGLVTAIVGFGLFAFSVYVIVALSSTQSSKEEASGYVLEGLSFVLVGLTIFYTKEIKAYKDRWKLHHKDALQKVNRSFEKGLGLIGLLIFAMLGFVLVALLGVGSWAIVTNLSVKALLIIIVILLILR